MEVVPDQTTEMIAKIGPKLRQKRSTPFHRSLVLGKSVKSSWQKKMDLKNEKKAIKAIEQGMKDEKQATFDEKKRRREENQKRREENIRKSEIVSKITNLKKLKKAKGMKRVRKV